MHFSLLVLSHTEIKPNKTLAPVHALLHEKLHPRLTFKPGHKVNPFSYNPAQNSKYAAIKPTLVRAVADLGERPWEPNPLPPSLFTVKKKKKGIAKEEKPAGQATEKLPFPPFPSTRSGSATEESITFKYFPGFCYGKFLRNRR